MDVTVERKLIAVLAAVQFTHIMDFMIIMPLGPQLMGVLGIDALQFGALVSTYTAASALACLISALVLDRFDRRSVLLFSYFLFALATLACGLADSYLQLMVARFLAGFFGGMISVLVQTIVADVVPFERRGVAMGKLMAAFSVATVAGVPLGLVAANYFSWCAPFLMLAAFSTVIWLFAWRLVPTLVAHMSGTAMPMVWAFLQVLGTRRYWFAYAFTVTMIFTGFVVIPFFTLYLQGNLGFSAEQIPLIYFVAGMATLVTAPLIGRLSDRLGKARVFMGLAASATVPLYLITHLQSNNLVFVLCISTLFFVVVSGRMIPAMAIISEVPDPRQRGAYMSLNNAVQSASMALAAFIGGWLAGGGGQLDNYALNGYVGIAGSLASIAMLTVVLKTLRNGQTT